ncbi:MAG: hypothetical protein KGI98_17660, partial [Euryarchaeota archaeon]|nr:hypothetical protein [Euryarchaeota archaeon]
MMAHGFNVVNLYGGGLGMYPGNPNNIDPSYEQCMRRIAVRRIRLRWNSTTDTGAPPGLLVNGSARQILFEDCDVDQSGAPNLTEGECIF